MFLHVLVGPPFRDQCELVRPVEVMVDIIPLAPAFVTKLIRPRIQGVAQFVRLISFCSYLEKVAEQSLSPFLQADGEHR